jgi:hypothetical protein
MYGAAFGTMTDLLMGIPFSFHALFSVIPALVPAQSGIVPGSFRKDPGTMAYSTTI